MGAKTKTVGGRKSAEGLSEEFISFLNSALSGRGLAAGPGGLGGGAPAGANAVGGVRGIYGDVLSGGAGVLGGNLGQLLEKSQERNVQGLRSRFGAQGGMAFGTPAAFAESLYRAEAAPQIATQVGQLQLSALNPIFSAVGDVYGRQTPQAQTVQQKGFLGEAAGFIGNLAGPAATFFAPGLGGASAARAMVNDPSGSFGGIRPPERLPEYAGPGR